MNGNDDTNNNNNTNNTNMVRQRQAQESGEGKSIPDDFLCPITMEIMQCPVVTRTGLNFECSAILEWLEKHPNCPLTRQPLRPSDLIRNVRLQTRIRCWELHSCDNKDSQYKCLDAPTDNDIVSMLPSSFLIRLDQHHQPETEQLLSRDRDQSIIVERDEVGDLLLPLPNLDARRWPRPSNLPRRNNNVLRRILKAATRRSPNS